MGLAIKKELESRSQRVAELDAELIDQLNLLRTSGNKLGYEGTANMNKFVTRAIV